MKINISDLFPGFGITETEMELLKATRAGIIYPAIHISSFSLLRLTREDINSDLPEELRFYNGEVYFETETDSYRIYKDIFNQSMLWVMESTNPQVEKYFFNRGEMFHFRLEVGKHFFYDKFNTKKVLGMVLLVKHPIKWDDALKFKMKESELVKKFS